MINTSKLLMTLLLFFSFLIGTLETQAAPELEQVTLQLKWQHQFQFAGYYAAIEQGFYAEEGLDVIVRARETGDNVLERTLSGQADYAISGAGLLTHYANGAPVKALAAIFQHDPLIFISKQSSGIISPYEMAGKRIMYEVKAGDDSPLTALLADAGINREQFTLVPQLVGEAGKKAFINNEVDVMSVYLTSQPFHLQQQGIKLNIINPQNYGFDFYGDILYTSQKELNNHPGRAERFRRASLKGWQYALAHPEELIQLIKDKYGSGSSLGQLRYEAREIRKLILADTVVIGTMEPARLKRLADIYTRIGTIQPLDEQRLNNFMFDSSKELEFSDEEVTWLNNHKTIRVGVDRDFAPYEWVDDEGNYFGLASDYIRLIETRLGIKFEIIADRPWHEILTMAQNNELDMLSCLSHSRNRSEYIFFSSAYVSNPIVIVNANRNGYVGALKNLEGKKVAIENGYATHDNLVANYPEIDLLVVDSTHEALEKVAVGEADAYIGDAAYANYAIKQGDFLNLQFAGQTEDSNSYRIGIQKSHPELLSIINKVLDSINQQDRLALKSRWFDLKLTTGVQYETAVQVLVAFGILLLLFLLWIYRLRESKRSVLQSEARLKLIIDTSPIPHLLTNHHQQVAYINKAFIDTFGYQIEDIPTLRQWNIQAYPDVEYRHAVAGDWHHRLERVRIARQKFEQMELDVQCKNGECRHVLINIATIGDYKDEMNIVILYDITARKRAEEKLYLSGRVFNEAHEGIMITDADQVIIDINPAFSEITGYSRDTVIGQHPSLLRSDKHDDNFYLAIQNELKEHGYWQGEIWSKKKNGTLYAELLTVSTLLDDAGEVVNYLSLFSDVTESKRQQKKLEIMAHYDELTQLPNRTLFSDRFNQAIARSKRDNSLLAVVFIDLDDFKPVNDNLGHSVGDQLLVRVAKRIKDSIREGDTASRLGGDEFALLFNNVQSIEHCELMTSRILEAISQLYLIADKTITISASAGITLYPFDSADPDTLLRHADQAMYQAKLKGRNCHHLFDAMQDQKISLQHTEIQTIEAAWRADQFCLFYQPKVNMRTGEVVGAEALIRWDDPEKGIIPPLSFLPAIEGTELEIKVGNWVIEQALKQMDVWHQKGMKFEVSVNISSHHLQWEGFVHHLDTTLAKYPHISSQCLQLEILESSILTDISIVSDIIDSCRQTLGLRVSLDDFGTGYSSLTHLRHLPVDVVKIDRSFVRDLLDDRDDYTIVNGVIGLTHAFRCEVIAEGVETTEHGLMLMMMGCDYAQGYGIAFPMTIDDFQEWYDSRSMNAEWLSFNRLALTETEKWKKLFLLESGYWFKRLTENVTLAPDRVHYWPVTNYKKSFSALWSEQARQQHLLDGLWLNELDEAYRELYQIGASLKAQYLSGDEDLVQQGIVDLQASHNVIEQLMRDYT